jgi:hypothetical protein
MKTLRGLREHQVKIDKIVIPIVIACVLSLTISVGNAGICAPFLQADANPNSPRYGQQVGPYDSVNKGSVTLWMQQSGGYTPSSGDT